MRHLPLLLVLLRAASAAAQCSSWSSRYEQFLDGVCVCNASSCDSVSDEYQSLTISQLGVFQTSKAGDRLAFSSLALEAADDATAADIVIDSAVSYQEIIGFGGAFTDATAINVYLLEDAVQQQLIDAYYSDAGLGYTLGRIPIASTDFSTYVYSYNDMEGDFEMTNFTIAADKAPLSNKLELIQRALNASQSAGRNVTMFASSWAPPVWLTTSNTTVNCEINGTAGGPYWEALALYYSKFIDAYEAEGVPIWGLTTQNEPHKQAISLFEWQSLRFTAEEERDFIKKDLGPILKQNHPDVKLIILDDQKDLMVKWNASLEDTDARQYVSGVGVHWYKNVDFIADTFGNFEDLAEFHALYPDVFILATEACEGSLLDGVGTGRGTVLTNLTLAWQRGENYARDIINDLANFAGGWTDWNLVLDTSGGPNWAGNVVDAPILVDEEGGQEFYKQPMFYVMGHFSKFLSPGAVQVALNVSNSSTTALEKVDRVAFRTPSDDLVLILSNRDSSAKSVVVKFAQEQLQATITVPANAVQTILWSSQEPSGSGGSGSDGGSNSALRLELSTLVAIIATANAIVLTALL